MSSGYEEQELTAIDAALDANPDATTTEVFQATRPYDERAIASAAASRALAGGGGASSLLWASFVNKAGGSVPANSTLVLAWEANANGVGTLPVTLADLGDGADTTFELPAPGMYLVTVLTFAYSAHLSNGSVGASLEMETILFSNDHDPRERLLVTDPTGSPSAIGVGAAIVSSYVGDFNAGFQVSAYPTGIDLEALEHFAEVKIVQLAEF